MDLTFVSVDNNETSRLFPRDNFDPKGLARKLRDRRLHLHYTEDSLAEALGLGETEAAYGRLCRIAEFAEVAGAEWFSVGAGLVEVIEHELEFGETPASGKFPRSSHERQTRFFSHLSTRDTFDHWHQTELASIKEWANAQGMLDQDKSLCVRDLPFEQFVERFPKLAGVEGLEAHHAELQKQLATPASAVEFIAKQIALIPLELATNWALEKLVEDDAKRARVASEPARCPTIVAYAGALTLNRCGAVAGVETGWTPNTYKWLTPILNNYADARIIAQAAYGHVVASNDEGLRRRAECLKQLGLYRPQAMRWTELVPQ